MEKLRSWITNLENRRTIPADELEIVSLELKYDVIGVKGGNMFTITYAVLWNVSFITNYTTCITRAEIMEIN